MSLLTELFGEKILAASLPEVKQKIKELVVDRLERKTYLLKDYASIAEIKLTAQDFKDIGV